MKGIVVDTNVLIEIISGNKKIINQLKEIRKSHNSPPTITVLNYSEILFGLMNKKNYGIIKEYLDTNFSLLTISRSSAELFAKTKYKQIKSGKTVPSFDLLIACITMDLGYTLITKDRHFSMIKGLSHITL